MKMSRILEFLLNNRKAAIKAIAGIIILAVAFFVYFGKADNDDTIIITGTEPQASTEAAVASSEEEVILEEEKNIVVDIGGAVEKPGVVTLKDGDRVYQAVDAAGGITSAADTKNINMAAALKDGDKVYIPSKSEAREDSKLQGIVTEQIKQGNGQSEGETSGLVNINTATTELLQTLKGVGPSTAEKIIEYRNTYGNFKKIEDLKNVSGIGEKTFEKLKPSITV